MSAGQVAMSPEVKRLVADEVRWQISLENSEAQSNATNRDIDPSSSGIVRMLDGEASHVFVAGRDFDFVGTGGVECAISAGDVLQLQARPDQQATEARLIVLSGKGGSECANGGGVFVPLVDLQEMQKLMSKKFGITATDTLAILQKLYDAKLISYPRTDCRHLREDMKDKLYASLVDVHAHLKGTRPALHLSQQELMPKKIAVA